ncbi:DNA-directed RNA polymerase subunit delta [Tetzosporium hominis]|uniref:Probable DNA-directed RNA polymerase subunit delta n=1 Tax=Tetzosporium hominis TaxID=2020506 RepID=A0A264W288_9BACL|nr:DNA-directed RNA polymerase subunit delta [Tetzosporium hominis]OZS77683.1 DNA-directed RNA polymerase subunit delta [Tetzosporium hominis]
MNFRDMTKEQLQEESLINLAFAILTDRREALELQDLFQAIQDVSGYTDEEMEKKKLQFYTDMNIDGRFLATSEYQWGLREWYPVDTIEEESAPTVKVRKKKAKVVDEDEEILEDEDELLYDEDEELEELIEDDDDDEDEDEVLLPVDEDLIEDEDDEEFDLVDAEVEDDEDEEDLEDEEEDR